LVMPVSVAAAPLAAGSEPVSDMVSAGLAAEPHRVGPRAGPDRPGHRHPARSRQRRGLAPQGQWRGPGGPGAAGGRVACAVGPACETGHAVSLVHPK
jgi:hypothetical protein